MDSFVKEILSKIYKENCPLSIVQNTDGFLSRVDTQQTVRNESGVILLPGTALELRIHYERWFKGSSEKFCYVVNDLEEILPDIKTNAYISEFEVTDVLWGYNKAEVKKWNAPFSVIKSLYEQKQYRPLTADQTKEIMGYVADESLAYNLDPIISRFRNINLNWLSAETVESVSKELLSLVSNKN